MSVPRFEVFDTETHLIKPGCPAPKMVCLSTADRKLFHRVEGLAWLKEQLEDPNVVIVGHNVFYDLGVPCAEDPATFVPLVFKAFDNFRIRDTIVRQQLLDIAEGNLKYRWDEEKQEHVKTGYGLDDLALRLLNRVLPKEGTWRLKYALLDEVPISEWPEDAKSYAIDDSITTSDVFWAQALKAGGNVEAGGTIPTEERATREAWALWLMGAWGIRTEGKAVAKLRSELEEEQRVSMAKLAKTDIIKRKKDGTWSRHMKAIYARIEKGFLEQGKEVPRTPSGRVATDHESMVDCKDPGIAVLAEAAGGAKLLNTYVPVLERGTRVPINARFNVLVESNRTSCSSPNCFDAETEVLTFQGWVKFKDLSKGLEVAQWSEDGRIEFVRPTKYVKQVSADVLKISGERNIDLVVTSDHRCLLQHRKTGELRVFAARDYPEDWHQLHGGTYSGPGMDVTDTELRLLIATQADGYYHDGGIEFGFAKQRKVDRLRSILEKSGNQFSCRPPTEAKPETRLRLYVGELATKIMKILGPTKVFGPWILELSRRQLDIFVEEVFFWDGLWTRKSNWASSIESNTDWVQTALALSGMRARKRIYRNALPNAKPSHQVDLRRKNYSMTTNRTISRCPAQTMYCVSVPSSYLLIRRGKVTMVTGNCQNPPRKGGVRESFVARHRHLFCSTDYDTIELRSLAQSCLDLLGHSAMAAALQKGEDLHLNLAADLLGISHEEAAQRMAAGDEQVSEHRQLAKIMNFGAPGGLSPDTFVDYAKGYGVKVEPELSHRLHAQWLNSWSEMKQYFEYVSSVVGRTGEGVVVSPRSGFVRGGLSFTQLANHYFQSLTATGAKDALWHVTRECYAVPSSPLYGCRPVIFMHDEVITEMPEERASAAAERQAQIMIEVMSRWIPDIPILAGPVLFRRWFKGAKAVRIDGKLVPSRPVKIEGKVKWVHDTGEDQVSVAA